MKLLLAACLFIPCCAGLPCPAVVQHGQIPMIKLTYTYRF